MNQWPRLREGGWLASAVGSGTPYAYWRSVLDAEYAGTDTWDYIWSLAHWLHDSLAIRPAVNLVANIGFGEGATHTRQPEHAAGRRPAGEMAFPLRHPQTIEANLERDAQIEWVDHSGILRRRMAMLSALRSSSPADQKP